MLRERLRVLRCGLHWWTLFFVQQLFQSGPLPSLRAALDYYWFWCFVGVVFVWLPSAEVHVLKLNKRNHTPPSAWTGESVYMHYTSHIFAIWTAHTVILLSISPFRDIHGTVKGGFPSRPVSPPRSCIVSSSHTCIYPSCPFWGPLLHVKEHFSLEPLSL